ncbi:MAG: TRAP transporter large permease subunit [Oscillospiraceae bacterium]|nr:TRAP transporter large permease subunit [Oscillospiraceae bacterium]
MKANKTAAWGFGLFVAVLIVSLILSLPIIVALIGGYIIFVLCGVHLGHPLKKVLKMSLEGVKTVKDILLTFILIGIMTALWRSGGTIAAIVYYASRLIAPQVLVLMTFILCCAISMLTGTSFGTAATMGVICMAMGLSSGANPVFMGGAILAGSFFGDRCSPMSTSALLVSQVTGTDIYKNIRAMIKTCIVPFIISCAAFLAMGFLSPGGKISAETLGLLERGFDLHWTTVIPAALIVILSAFKLKVRKTMAVSIVAAVVICLAVQKQAPLEIVKTALLGYTAPDAEVNAVLGGGGIISMVSSGVIVGLSSSYSGIFAGTGLLDGIQGLMEKLAGKITSFGAILLSGAFTCIIACNQTLPIILTEQLCSTAEPSREKLALNLENTVVIIAALVPWSIAATVPLSSAGAPLKSILAACFLYITPLWCFAAEAVKMRRKSTRRAQESS